MKYEPLEFSRSSVSLLFIISGIWYIHWRLPTLAPDHPFFSALLYGAEIYGFLSALLHLMMTWRLTIREAPPCPEGMSVDVFVPSYNEPVDLVRKTLLAAKNMDYPHETWLLDDGNRQDMKALAERLGVRYLARAENTHAKAGNLNHGLGNSHGDFIAIFDADHAPQKQFLTQTLGYFNDAAVAFVQTPQDFFNLDSYQHRWQKNKKALWTEQSLFFKVIQRGKDYWNAAFFCGSCAVVRRSAIDSIGGFATETLTEDLHTSVKLHKAGFRSVYVAEPLAFGIAPASVAPFLKQRVRWGRGAMQVFKLENILFCRHLTLAQKLNYLASILTYFDGWQKGIFYFAPAVVLIAGIMPIRASGFDFLAHFLPYYILSIVVFEEVGRGYGGILFAEQYNFARFAAFAWATLGLFTGKGHFDVTSKVRARSPTTTRVFLPQQIVLLLNAAALPFSLGMALTSHYLPAEAIGFNIVWACINCILAFTMMRFTKKTEAFLREDYRFPIPLPVIIREPNGDIRGTIDNISASGCRIYAWLPATARVDQLLQGEIQLPSGPLPFNARITSEIKSKTNEQVFVKAIGCNFQWHFPEHRDALELFLYGSDLQHKLIEVNECETTLFNGLDRRTTRGDAPMKIQSDEHWATCEIIHNGNDGAPRPSSAGLLPLNRDGSPPRQLVSFIPLATHADVRAWVFTRTGQIGMRAKVGAGDLLENSAGPLYLYSLLECTIPFGINDVSSDRRDPQCDAPSLQSA